MKYHYQFVSPAKVRIEIIPEDNREHKLIHTLEENDNKGDVELAGYFQEGLKIYNGEAILTRMNFMQFPKVALCSFEMLKQAEKKPVQLTVKF